MQPATCYRSSKGGRETALRVALGQCVISSRTRSERGYESEGETRVWSRVCVEKELGPLAVLHRAPGLREEGIPGYERGKAEMG